MHSWAISIQMTDIGTGGGGGGGGGAGFQPMQNQNVKGVNIHQPPIFGVEDPSFYSISIKYCSMRNYCL